MRGCDDGDCDNWIDNGDDDIAGNGNSSNSDSGVCDHVDGSGIAVVTIEIIIRNGDRNHSNINGNKDNNSHNE